MRRRLLTHGKSGAATVDIIVVLVSEDGSITQRFASCANAATYATENSGTNWNLTIKSGEVPDNCFKLLTNLISLTLEEGVTAIGHNAFHDCSKLTGDLVIPDSVTAIDYSAFYGCSGFDGNLTIGNGVITIGETAFRGCSGFTGSLTIPNSVTTIGQGAFYNCRGFDGNLTIPSSVTSIGASAFYNCSKLTGDLIIPSSVTSIGASAFQLCSSFNGSLTIPNSITAIEQGTFQNCSGLTGDLVIPEAVTTIGMSAFYGCSGFNGTLTLPENVNAIGYQAFYGCSGLKGSLVIPASVTSIGGSAFYSCSGFDDDLYYYGLTNPSEETNVFNSASFTACRVPADYEDDNFCGLPVFKILGIEDVPELGVMLEDGTELSFLEALSRRDLTTENVAGIIFKNSTKSFIIGLNQYSSRFCLANYYNLTGYDDMPIYTQSEAQSCYDGESDTEKLANYEGSTGRSGTFSTVRNYYILNNTKRGYMWSVGEAILAWPYKDSINILLEYIGGDPLVNSYYLAPAIRGVDEYNAISTVWGSNSGTIYSNPCEAEGYVRPIYEYEDDEAYSEYADFPGGVLLEDGTELTAVEAMKRDDLTAENVAGIIIEGQVPNNATNVKIIVGLEEKACYFTTNETDISSIIDSFPLIGLSSSVASQDVDGENKTDALCSVITNSDYACQVARSYTILNGTKQGYLPALGEACVINENIEGINALISHCGGTELTIGRNYWSSTLNTATDNLLTWVWIWSPPSYIDGGRVEGLYYCRPVFAYD